MQSDVPLVWSRFGRLAEGVVSARLVVADFLCVHDGERFTKSMGFSFQRTQEKHRCSLTPLQIEAARLGPEAMSGQVQWRQPQFHYRPARSFVNGFA